jgi:hypothetical protein
VTSWSVSEGYSAPLLASECDLGQAVARRGGVGYTTCDGSPIKPGCHVMCQPAHQELWVDNRWLHLTLNTWSYVGVNGLAADASYSLHGGSETWLRPGRLGLGLVKMESGSLMSI